ncbi:MAG: FG-GAP repeat domain-containing protein [Thermoplasmatota archaeon]
MRAEAAALVLVLPMAFAALAGDSAPVATRILAISTATAHPQVPFKGFDSVSKAFDFNGDGQLEIVAQNDNHWVYVLDSRTGAILAELTTTRPPYWEARSFNVPEVAVFDSDGTVRLILQNSAAYITSYRFEPAASSATSFSFAMEWERRLDECHPDPGSDSKPVLGDLDGDGRFEIVAATEELGIYALREDGSTYWKNCMGGGNAEPTLGDVDLDGLPDVLYGSDAGIVTALGGKTGWTLWSYDVSAEFGLGSGSMPVGVAVGQLDGALGPDVVVGARDSHDPLDWSNDHALLLALDSTGGLLWAVQDPLGNPLTYTHPVIVDADGDGEPEVYWGDWNTIGHKPPEKESESWLRLGPGNYYRFDARGNMVWRQSLESYWSNNDLVLADVDGDGKQDVLANGPGPGGDGFWALDSATGEPHGFVGTYPWQVAGGPVVSDLWGTGTMQWVVEVGPADDSVSGGGILVYDTGMPYDSVFPHAPDPDLHYAAPPAPPPATETPTETPAETPTQPPEETQGPVTPAEPTHAEPTPEARRTWTPAQSEAKDSPGAGFIWFVAAMAAGTAWLRRR